MNVRSVQESDWPQIAYLASDDVQEGDHIVLDQEWIARRRDPAKPRYAFVLERDGEIVSYGALEEDPAADGYRAFLVMDWSADTGSIAAASYRELERIAVEQGISRLWMREMAGDASLLGYMISQGFTIDREYEYEGFDLVNLSKTIGT